MALKRRVKFARKYRPAMAKASEIAIRTINSKIVGCRIPIAR
jgi:hypothetical protein